MEGQRNIYYVYLHRRADTGEIFYVGKGSRDRATTKRKRSAWWTRIEAKYGRVIEYIETCMEESEALNLEVELIRFYRSIGCNLCNHTDGGEGSSGYKHTEEAKIKISSRLIAKGHREKMVKAIGRPVLCSNGMTFETCKDAEVWLGNAPSASKVSTCCRRESCQAGGYVWRFLDDCEDLREVLNDGKDAYVEFGCEEILSLSSPKPVACSNGMLFESAGAAARWLVTLGHVKANSSPVVACCRGRKKLLYGFSFSYAENSN